LRGRDRNEIQKPVVGGKGFAKIAELLPKSAGAA
jgi:hypothetical protein